MSTLGVGNCIFDELRERAQLAVDAGELDRAEAVLDQALAWARREGTPDQVEYTVCSRAGIAIQRGGGEAELPVLRKILLRSGNLETTRKAAYQIAVYYLFHKNYKKSLSYARIARDRAEALGNAKWRAASHNLVGNSLLGEGYVEEACLEYQRAHALMPPEPSVLGALILQNLGYCCILQRFIDEGYELLYKALRRLRGLGAALYLPLVHLDLCFAHLESGRFGHAHRRGLAGLRLAERLGQNDAVKNALYLLGEAANLAGDSGTAHSYFSRLQRDHYPDAGYLPGFLLAVDIRKMINLHA
jgi:tetratricopeptide (TPR) repeat protein